MLEAWCLQMNLFFLCVRIERDHFCGAESISGIYFTAEILWFCVYFARCINNVNKVGLQACGIHEANMIYSRLALRLAFKELMFKVRSGRWGLLKIIVHW